ncbi:hypothetical protein OO008_19825 [Cocleimonas sp. KMM 6895]|uniref:hypothetical protein n=2 Tax=Cocleimonas TaxID=998014 RepID=UPI002DB5869F|nr:hypothetical protein [Cocleimonas sp. KMM 6892]MEC4717438.1 hypothetical protein [Cocleimonas sp. KMM 6895]
MTQQMEQLQALKRNDIVIATVIDSLGDPKISEIQGYKEYTASIRQPEVLRGMDSAELRVLEVDEENRKIKVCFHAVDKFNPNVSTGRIINVTYQSMQNTVSQIFRNLF